jgi:RHS repeat-associated protein
VGETDTPSSSLSPASYTYDAQSRVTADTAGTSGTKTYAQDRSSNLTTLPTGASGTYDNASELTASVLSGTTTSYTYDAAGNRTQASVGGTTTVSATYNGAGRVTSYDNAAANMSSASYNGLGLRASATTTPSGGGASTQNFVWNTADSTPNLLMDSTNAYIYGPYGTPFEQVSLSSGTIHYLVADLLGSVRGVVSSSGSLSATTSYDAWGNPQTSGGLMSYTPLGLGGGYSDATGLIYLLARYYDPSSGQFLSVDPMVDTTGQPYAFVNDNPLNSTDPLGLLGAGYPRTDWKQELKVWNSGGLNELIGIGLGAIASVAAVVAFVATSPEIVLAATVVAAVAGLGAEATDGVRCLSGARSACPGAILGLPGLVVAIAAFAPVESAIALAAPAASAMFAVAIIVTDSVIKFVQTMTKSSKRAKLPS